jgi:LysM repeat protein
MFQFNQTWKQHRGVAVGTALSILVVGMLTVFACRSDAVDSAAPATTPTATATLAPPPTATPDSPAIYVVKSGDTGLAIALRFGITLAALSAANQMTEKEMDVLFIGQELVIPR